MLKVKEVRTKDYALLGRIFSLALALIMISSTLVFQPALSHQQEVSTEATTDLFENFYDDIDIKLTQTQQQALAEIELERLNRGLVGFEGDYALADDDSLVSVIVLFESSPAAVQILEAGLEGVNLSELAAEQVVEDEHALFRRELTTLFNSQQRLRETQVYTIGWEYRVALNGVNITLPSHLVAELAYFESVRAIYPDIMMTHDAVEVETLAEALRNPPGMAPGRETMRADDMHELGYRGEGVVIAVLDTGIDYHHPAFYGAFLTLEEMRQRNPELTEAETIDGVFYGRNFIDDVALFPTLQNPEEALAANDPMETTYDFWSGTGLPRYSNPATGAGRFFTAHGTHVAGTILARDTGGDLASLGVAPEARMFAYRVLGPRGSGPTAGVVASIEQAVYDRPDIVNMSLGSANNTPAGWPTTTAVNNVSLTNPDILFVISAGNSGSNFHTVASPGTASTALTVSNIVEAGNVGVMMNHGATEYEIRFASTPANLWTYDPDLGLIVSTWDQLEHEDGAYRLFALPRTNATNAAPGPAPGVGSAADFEALVEKYGAEALQGAFVFIRRGYAFVDVAATANELGLGGVIVINNTNENVATGIPILPLPYIFIGLDYGIALYEQMQEAIAASEPSTITFSEFLWTPFRLSGSSSRGPILESFEIKPDVGANGTNVFSPVPAWWLGAGGGTDYGIAYANMSGTSMSAPHIAGGVALLIEYSRRHTGTSWEAEELKVRTMNTAIPFERGFYSVFDKGTGYMDVYAAAHAQTVVSVYYDRVATESGIAFEDQNFQTTRTGSFSFGGFNLFGLNTRPERSLSATIANHAATSTTYVITYEFLQDGRNTQNPTGQVTFNLSETTLTVPAGETAQFDASLQIELDATAGFYEGFVTVAELGGDVVARLPFAGVVFRYGTLPVCDIVSEGSFAGPNGSAWRICADGTLEVNAGVINWTGALSPWHAHRDLITQVEITGPILAGASLRALFRELTFVTTIEGLTYFDTTATTSMYRMFFGLSGVTELDVTSFNTSAVTNMALMFRDASSLVEIDVSNFNTYNVRDMREMFRATSIEKLDLTGFDTSHVTNMNQMFTALHTLNELILGESFSFIGAPNLVPLRQTESYTGLWQGAGGVLTSAQLMARFDGQTMAGTFVRQAWTETDPEICDIEARGRFANGATIGGAQWHLCSDGTLEIGPGFMNWTLATSPWHAYRSDITEIVFTGEVTGGAALRSLFHDLANLEEIHHLAYLDTSQVTSMARMFRGASSLTELDLSSFDTSHVTDMSWMFFGASGLETLDVTNFATNNVTNMALMFRETSSLVELDVTNFDTTGVTDMREMFRGMSSLEALDLAHFDTSNVTNMNHMFVGMSALTELILGDLFTPIGSPGIPRLH